MGKGEFSGASGVPGRIGAAAVIAGLTRTTDPEL